MVDGATTDPGASPSPDPSPGPGPAPKLSTGRIWWFLGVAFVLWWCLFLVFSGPKVPPTPPDLVGTDLRLPADYGWTLHDLEGRPVSFAQYRGKAVLLNIWATWCPSCIEELPTIAETARSPRLRDVAFVCVSIDEDADDPRAFLQGQGKDWPMTFLHAGPQGLPIAFTAPGDGMPATYLIAPDGRIAASTVGGANWADHSVVDFLENLASEKPAPRAEPGAR
jgi:thiol-disulfide isomerase/thioredoxin